MTDLTPKTTPTRDEAVSTGWKLVPVDLTEAMWLAGREADTHPGDSYSAVYAAMLASAPAPASGGVDAVVAVKALMKAVQRAEDGAGTIPAKEAVKLRPSDWHAVCDRARAIASLSPAATPVSEAGGEEAGWTAVAVAEVIYGKPASSPAGGDVVRAALEAIIADWDERSVGEQERFVQMHEDRPGYWSPNARMVSSEKIAAGRIALSQSTSAGRVGE